MGRMQTRFKESHSVNLQSKYLQLKLRKSLSGSLNLRRRYLVKILAIVNIQTTFPLQIEKVLLDIKKTYSLFDYYIAKLLFVKNQGRWRNYWSLFINFSSLCSEQRQSFLSWRSQADWKSYKKIWRKRQSWILTH